MRFRFPVVLLAALTIGGCGNSPTAPAAPPPIPAANLVAEGGLTLLTPACMFTCAFQGQLRNTGAGCANTIRGTTRFFNSAGTELAALGWSKAASFVVRPGELMSYNVAFVPRSVVDQASTFSTEASWTNVRC